MGAAVPIFEHAAKAGRLQVQILSKIAAKTWTETNLEESERSQRPRGFLAL